MYSVNVQRYRVENGRRNPSKLKELTTNFPDPAEPLDSSPPLYAIQFIGNLCGIDAPIFDNLNSQRKLQGRFRLP